MWPPPFNHRQAQRKNAKKLWKGKNPESQNAKPTRTTRSAAAAKHTLKPQAGKPKLALAKATFGIRPDQMTLLEEIRVEARKRGEKPPSKYDLAVEAFDLLARKYERK